MNKKKFVGKDLREALALVKEAMGADAMILATRSVETAEGKGMEVEAVGQIQGLEVPAALLGLRDRPAGRKEETFSEPRLPAGNHSMAEIDELENGHTDRWTLYAELSESGIDGESAWEILTRAESDLEKHGTEKAGSLRGRVREILSHLFETGEAFREKKGAEPAIANFIGPTGAGTTTTVIKLAAACTARHRLRVGLIALNTSASGGVAHLRAQAARHRLPFIEVCSIDEMNRAIQKFQKADLILVDTPGRSHRDSARMEELPRFFGEGRPGKNFFVISANTHHHDIIQMGKSFSRIPLAGLIFTKLDESSRFGVIFRLHMELGVPVSYLTAGQEIPKDIEEATAKRLASLVLPVRRKRFAPRNEVAV